MHRAALLLFSLPLLNACAAAPSPQAKAWYAERDKYPTHFYVAAADLPAVMARAAVILAREGDLPILTSTDRVIQTAMPARDAMDTSIGATVTATPLGEGFTVQVMTRYSNGLLERRAWRLARAIAYYAATGNDFPDR